jgi:microcystin-dependent protein
MSFRSKLARFGQYDQVMPIPLVATALQPTRPMPMYPPIPPKVVPIAIGEYPPKERPLPGDILANNTGFMPPGYLLCDGSAVSRTTYSVLYKIIGTYYGDGDLSTTFNLPNPAGRVLGVIGSGSGLTTRVAGASVGEERHTLSVGEMPTHNHGVTDPGHHHSYVNQPNTANPATSLTTMGVADDSNVTQQTGDSTTGITINNNGSSLHHNNMQPTLFVGNMFVFCGRINYGTYPYTVGSNIF